MDLDWPSGGTTMRKIISSASIGLLLGTLGVWHGAHAQVLIGNPIKLTGAWYDPSVSGQGLLIEVAWRSDGTTDVFGSWFTYSLPGYSGSSPEWFTFQTHQTTPTTSSPVDIFYTSGGQFDAPPVTRASFIGTGALRFIDCRHAYFSYSLPAGILNSSTGGIYSGTISMVRLSADPGCGIPQYVPTTRGFSGAWYDPTTSGQGFLLDVGDTAGGLLFGGWFTYGINSFTNQAWYTLQGPFPAGATEADVVVYRAKDETFRSADVPDGGDDKTRVVGTAHIKFTGCEDAQLEYSVAFPNMSPASRIIPLKRLTPTPGDCPLLVPVHF